MSRTSILAAALLVVLQGTQAAAQPACKPVLTVKDVGFSEVINLRRFWTATVMSMRRDARPRPGLFASALFALPRTGWIWHSTEPFFWQPDTDQCTRRILGR